MLGAGAANEPPEVNLIGPKIGGEYRALTPPPGTRTGADDTKTGSRRVMCGGRLDGGAPEDPGEGTGRGAWGDAWMLVPSPPAG